MSDQYPNLHPSLTSSFVALSPDPEVPLTEEQLQATFPNQHAWQEMLDLTMKQHNIAPEDVDHQDFNNEKSA